ncbi:MAG: PIN domain-containing protein [Candidatus Bathyarchaeota archaeon]
MNTLEGSLAYDGVLDVGVVVPACFENPLKEYSVNFLADVLSQRMRVVLPVTVVIGAYHITTRYLKVSRLEVKKVLEGLLRTRSPALYPNVRPELAVDALDYAVAYDIESWDGYLIALARSLQAKIVYSLDEGLAKIREITVVNPFPRDKLQEYHSYVKAKIA